MTDARQQKGLAIARTLMMVKASENIWFVPSQRHGGGSYVVDTHAGNCTCADHVQRGLRCKHIWAALYVQQEAIGNVVPMVAAPAVR